MGTDEEKKRGWCATHTNDDGEIKGWGVCREECSNPSLGYSYANMNLLTDEECKNLIRYRREEAAKDEEIEWTDPAFDSNRELCAGKKTKIVDTAVVFVRRRKKKIKHWLRKLDLSKRFQNIIIRIEKNLHRK